MRAAAALAGLVLLVAAPACADAGAECLVGWRLGGALLSHAACTDGDPACDADGAADGGCTLAVALCLNLRTAAPCAPAALTGARVRGRAAAPIAVALAGLAFPIEEAETCTPPMPVRLALGRRRLRRGRLVATARDPATRRRDRDRLDLACLRPSRPSGRPRAVVVTTDFETGLLTSVRVTPPRTVARLEPPIHSDAVVRIAGGLVYVVNRFLGDNLQVLDPARGFATVIQCTTGPRSNPHDVVVLEPRKAYVSRYGSRELWIVDPLAASCAEFRRGSIDLGPWADADGIPEMDQMALAGGRLFVTLARLDRGQRFLPAGRGRVVVIDTATDRVIDVIELSGQNPFGDSAGLPHEPGTGKLVVAEVGDIFAVGDGGLERLDPFTLQAEGFFVTEGDLGGNLTDFVLVSPTKAYAIVQDRDLRNVLVAFDPSTGTVVRRLFARAAFLPDVALAPDGTLWLADETFAAPGLRIFDPADDRQLTTQPIDVGLPPFSIGFLP